MRDPLQMYTEEEVRKLLGGISASLIIDYRDTGILRPTRCGNHWMYSRHEILRFQREAAGHRLGNRQEIIEYLNKKRKSK